MAATNMREPVFERLKDTFVSTVPSGQDGVPALRVVSVSAAGVVQTSTVAEDSVHTSGDLGTPVLAVRSDTAVALAAAGDYIPLMVGPNGGLWVSLATLLAGENLTYNRLMTAPQWSSTSIVTQTTTAVKAAPGMLGGILIPTPVANATIKVWDSLSAAGAVLIDTITFPAALLSSGPVVLMTGQIATVGITVVTAGATMAVDVLWL